MNKISTEMPNVHEGQVWLNKMKEFQVCYVDDLTEKVNIVYLETAQEAVRNVRDFDGKKLKYLRMAW